MLGEYKDQDEAEFDPAYHRRLRALVRRFEGQLRAADPAGYASRDGFWRGHAQNEAVLYGIEFG